MKLILAEKPELAQDIANAIMKTSKKNNEGIFSDDDYVCIPLFGHIIELCEPEYYDEKLTDRKNIDYLPIYFNNWKKVPSKEPYKRNRLKLIGKYIKKADAIIHAGDPDDEGQLLVDEVIEYYNYKGNVYRVYINDNIEKNIKKAFNSIIENNQECRNRGLSAYARQMADKTVGINYSRLASARLNISNLSAGRVQMPTLGLVVMRDESIRNHIRQKYYTLDLIYNCIDSTTQDIVFHFAPEKDLCDQDRMILSSDKIIDIKSYLEKNQDADFIEKEKEEKPPFPYSLNTLSTDMNKKYGYSSKEVLDATQSLRDKRAITYNRTDSEYLKNEHFYEAEGLIPIIFRNLGKEFPVDFQIRSECFNDKYAPTHHAIIPQEKNIDLSELSEIERNIYASICERYIMQFLPPERKRITEAEIYFENFGTASFSQTEIVDEGYRKYFKQYTESTKNIRSKKISPGKHHLDFKESVINEKETEPLKHYTEGTLIKDMCNISKYVEDSQIKKILKKKDEHVKGENGSIGTVATRAGIIEILKKRGFIEDKGRNIVSTKLGQDYFKILPESLKTADLTARWWILQEMIKKGKKSPNVIMMSAVEQFRQDMNTAFLDQKIELSKESFCRCPECGGHIYKRKTKTRYVYMCENSENGCPIKLYSKSRYFDNELNITDAKAKQLLSGKAVQFRIKGKFGDYKIHLKIKTVERNGTVYINLIKE